MLLILPGKAPLQINATAILFSKCSARYWLKHKWQATLMLIGMTLGVAIIFAVDIANESSKRAFSLSLDAVTGRTTHQIIGSANGIDDTIYTRLRTQLGVRNSAPVIQGTINLIGSDGSAEKQYTETLQLLGVDLFAEPMFRNQPGQALPKDDQANGNVSTRTNRDSLKLLHNGTVILAQSTAERLGASVGSSIEIADSRFTLTLISTVDTKVQANFENIAMVDISTAQEVLGLHGKLSRIDLVLPLKSQPAPVTQRTKKIEQNIEYIESSIPGVQVIEAARRNNALIQMTEAFHTNLLAMSLLALLVGAFLIYNTVTLSVIQRRTVFGQLRVVGVHRHELFRSIITETLAFAIVGTLAGVVLGYILGSALLTLVTRTINDLYFTLDVRQVSYSVFTLVKACGVGLGVSLLAAVPPALEAANSPPVTVTQRSSMEGRVSKIVPFIFMAGIGLIGSGALVLWISERSLWAAFLAIFFIVAGYSLTIPKLLLSLTSMGNQKTWNPVISYSSLGNYPLRSITASLSRTAIAIAALVVAVSATAGVGIMIGSFRLSVVHWLGDALQSDLYITSTASDNSLPAILIEDISTLENISGTRQVRMLNAETDKSPIRLMAVRNSGTSPQVYSFKDKANRPAAPNTANSIQSAISPEARMRLLNTTDSVLVAEPYSTNENIRVNDTLKINTDYGLKPFTVVGVFTNYTSGKGLVVLSMNSFHRYWSDRNIDTIGLTLSQEVNAKDTKKQLRGLLSIYNDKLLMRSNTEIRTQSLEIFDRTFAITHVLRLLTIGVAFIGILSALMALALERRSEYAVLRALGTTPFQLRQLLLWQTGLMGLIAGVLALPLGIAMSKILVSVINVRSFGWTMEYHIPPIVLLESLILAIIAALIAGFYPAYKLSQLSPAEALRHQ